MESILHAGSGLVTHAHVEAEYAKFLDDKRNSCVEKFLETDCTHLLFWDSDTVADTDAIRKLIDDNVEVASAVIYKKGGDHSPCFGYYDDKTQTFHTPRPFPYNELIQVDIAGTGFMLIKREVFDKVKAPWFECYDKGMAGEDVYFCAKCKDAGVKVWVDTALHLGHIATPYTITNETYEMSLFWSIIQKYKQDGRFEEFRKLVNDFDGKPVEELMNQEPPFNVFTLTHTHLGYRTKDQIKIAYTEYIKKFGDPKWAMSWPLAVYIDRMIHQTKPKRVLDLGSGFSSYLFRVNSLDTTSVDKDPKWLKKTKKFLKSKHLTTDGISSNPHPEGEFDIILLDYAMEDRVGLFQYCRDHGKIIFLDDMHYKDYREEAAKFFKEDLIFDLAEETTDAYGRYAWMVVPKRKQEDGVHIRDSDKDSVPAT